MKRFLLALPVAIMALSAFAATANATIHEMVAAYCSGGDVGVIDSNGFLEPKPLEDFGSKTFAKPVLASGAVDETTFTVTNKPNAKFAEGTSIFALSASANDHPSAAHCPGASALP